MKEPIAFSDVRVDGVRLILRAGHGFADAIIGQQRLIQLDARSFIYGEIERADGEEIVFYCGQGQNLATVPPRGQLELDVRQSQIAIKRQIGALDAVRRSEEHTSELQSLMRISYAVFCLKKKK